VAKVQIWNSQKYFHLSMDHGRVSVPLVLATVAAMFMLPHETMGQEKRGGARMETLDPSDQIQHTHTCDGGERCSCDFGWA